jgi:hypothetical protein
LKKNKKWTQDMKKQYIEEFLVKLQQNVMPRQPNSGPFLLDTLSNDLKYAISIFLQQLESSGWTGGFFKKF